MSRRISATMLDDGAPNPGQHGERRRFMTDLWACPFCREMYGRDEAKVCPACDIALVRFDKLPPSEEARELDEAEPEDERLPFMDWRRGRGLLAALALGGLVAFFLPWVHETAPERQVLSGFDLAQRLTWMWAPFVAWFVLAPLAASRRTISKMRGARLAVFLLGCVVAFAVAVRIAFVPESSPLRPVRFEWGFGLYLTGALAAAVMVAASRFGGRILGKQEVAPKPSKSKGASSIRRPPNEQLH